MKKRIFLALLVMSIFSALIVKTEASSAQCLDGNNICYVLRGPDGRYFYARGILVIVFPQR
ncbi:MAG: hypothetical protein RMJ89_03565 [Flammeovirgaceae bacterium]|nr:hypothetical protein [Flammeovirgaceae bacterium]